MPLLFPERWPRLAVPLHAFTVVKEYGVTTLFSSRRLLITLPAARTPSQLVHGAGASLPALPKFTYTERVFLSATDTMKFLVATAPLLSVAFICRECQPILSVPGLSVTR